MLDLRPWPQKLPESENPVFGAFHSKETHNMKKQLIPSYINQVTKQIIQISEPYGREKKPKAGDHQTDSTNSNTNLPQFTNTKNLFPNPKL